MVLIRSLNLDRFKNQASTVDKLLTVAKPSLDSLDTLMSLFDMVLIKRLNLNNFRTPVSAVKTFNIFKNQVLIEPIYPKVSIFDMVSIKSLDVKIFKIQVLIVNQSSLDSLDSLKLRHS